MNGNHDDGSIWDFSYVKDDSQKDRLNHDELYRLFYNHIPQKGIKVNDHALYYYMDDANSKIRYIFLDSNDVCDELDENGVRKYFAQCFFDMSQAQLDWLVNEALVFNEEGWGVVFFSHSILRKLDIVQPENAAGRESRECMRILHDILEAYKKGENAVQGMAKKSLKEKLMLIFQGE